ncbi:MAG: helicase-related protein, partial [Oscillospiraceae bacterium]
HSDKRERALGFVKKQLEQGYQGYIVCPLIEDSESDMMAAVQYEKTLQRQYFSKFRVGLLHGRLKGAEKDSIMAAFKEGSIDLLVSTTVVEVGVDVPNATVMMIENAERFGLSQLHQLRGRVGRGSEQSYCIMFYNQHSGVSQERMKVMCETNDGFKISEKDLEIRGPGEFFGTRQHGLPEMKIANFFTDMDILKETQEAVAEIISNDKELTNSENRKLKESISRTFESVGGNLN